MGRVFFWTVPRICQIIDNTISNDFDFNLVITGNRGCGKSTLAYKICKGVKFAKFKPRRDLLYSKDEVLEALSKRKESIVFGDEIIQAAFNRDFYSEHNKQLIKTLTMYRDSHNLFISCLPNFSALDNQVKSLIKMRIDVVKRGMAVVHTPNRTQYGKDGWDTDLNMKEERKWLTSKQKAHYTKLTTFRGILHFKDLNKHDKIIYQQLKDERRNLIGEGVMGDIKKKQTFNPVDVLYNLLMNKQIKSKEQFDNTCISFDTTPTIVRKKLSDRFRTEGKKITVTQLINA